MFGCHFYFKFAHLLKSALLPTLGNFWLLCEILNLDFIFLLYFLILYIIEGFLKVIMLNSGLKNHILSIVIIQIEFKFHTKWKKVVKLRQNRVKFILGAQV